MFAPRNEQGVLVRLVQEIEGTDISIKDVQVAFPDIILERDGQEWRVELEYKSSNFISHGHNPMGCDLVICWEKDVEIKFIPVVALADGPVDIYWEVMDSDTKELHWLRHVVKRQSDRIKKLLTEEADEGTDLSLLDGYGRSIEDVFSEYSDGSGALARGGIAAGIRSLFLGDAATSGRNYQEQRDTVLDALNEWRRSMGIAT